MHNRNGFTLVELMIVVAIIGILASIAIPNFIAMQYQTKRSEVPNNLDGIKTATIAYEAAFDRYIEQATFHPTSSPGKRAITWTRGSNFDTIGWEPDGNVRGAYQLTTLSSTNFLVRGICDVDGDGTQATFTAMRTVGAGMSGTGATIY